MNEFSSNLTGEYKQFLNILSKELTSVKGALKERRPFEFDIDRRLRELKINMTQLDIKLARTAHVKYETIPTAHKLISLGEIKAQYNQIEIIDDDNQKTLKAIADKSLELENLESDYATIEEKRNLVINTLNEYIQIYITESKNALDDYGEYCAWFDYKNKLLTLKKNKSASVAKISSSSDHLFLHLCLFAGMHQMFLIEDIPFVPSFLIIDQPSFPYFNNSEYNYSESESALAQKDDWSKVKTIFKLWDKFFELILEKEKSFQLIVLEHVAESAWQDCQYVHLVEVFDGIENALISPNYKKQALESNK